MAGEVLSIILQSYWPIPLGLSILAAVALGNRIAARHSGPIHIASPKAKVKAAGAD
jgi:hypothetical protein